MGILLIAVCITYSKVFGAGFMSWDDIDYVFNTPDITIINAETFANWWTDYYIGNYQPLPIFTYALDYAIGGNHPFMFHLDSIIWHITDAILLYLFMRRLQGNVYIALFVALLFAIHPVQTESVSWIAARNKVMNFFFFFLSAHVYIGYLRTQQNKKLVWVYVWAVVAYLCKLTAVTLPFALLAIDIWERRPLNNKKVWLEKLPLILLAIPIGIINLQAQDEVSFLNLHPEFTYLHTVVFAGYAYVQYLVNLLFPFKLSVLYPYPQELGLVHYLYTVLSVAIVAGGFVAYKRKLYVLAGGIAFYTVNIAIVLQFVQFGEVLMADRYLYVACVGVWYPVVYYIYQFLTKKSSAKTAAGVATALCLLYGVSTFARNDIWLSELNFWKSVTDKFPESSIAQSSLGGIYMKEGSIAQAQEHIDAAIKYDAKNYKAWYNKGVLLLRSGKANEALDALNKAIAIREYPKALFSRALLYQQTGNCRLALQDVNKVLEVEKNNARAYYIKADCSEQAGNVPEALANYDLAIQYEQQEPLFYLRRGLIHARLRKNGDAMRDMNEAIKLNPQYAEAYYWRGMMQYRSGMQPCADLQRAAQLGLGEAKKAVSEICK